MDKGNLLILGITAAMAWELPSKPFYIEEGLRHQYEMENVHRNDKNSTTLKFTASKKHSPSHAPITYNSKSDNHKSIYYTNDPIAPVAYEQHPINGYYFDNNGSPFGHANLLRPNYGHWRVPLTTNGYHLPSKSDKMQYYLSYADKMLKDFHGLTAKIPKNPSLSQFANV